MQATYCTQQSLYSSSLTNVGRSTIMLRQLSPENDEANQKYALKAFYEQHYEI